MAKELMEGPLKTILYADDIALIADSREELQDKVQRWQEVLAENGLRLNVKKTKFMSSEECNEPIIDCLGSASKGSRTSSTWGATWRLMVAWTRR